MSNFWSLWCNGLGGITPEASDAEPSSSLGFSATVSWLLGKPGSERPLGVEVELSWLTSCPHPSSRKDVSPLCICCGWFPAWGKGSPLSLFSEQEHSATRSSDDPSWSCMWLCFAGMGGQTSFSLSCTGVKLKGFWKKRLH